MARRAERMGTGFRSRGPGGRYLCWIAERDQRLGTALEAWGEVAQSAVDEGRVFVGDRRAKDPDQTLLRGDRVEVHPAECGSEPVSVLAERAGLIAVDKPAGVPSEPDRSGRPSLVDIVAAQLCRPRAELHVLSRLDLGVSGVVLVAQNRAARLRALSARSEGKLVRRYVALATCCPVPPRGRWEQGLVPPRLSARGGHQDRRSATTAYAVVSVVPTPSSTGRARDHESAPAMLAVEPLTGRTHQIRAHAAGARAPLFGDRAYGGPARLVAEDGRVLELRRIALHASRVSLEPEPGERWHVESPVPAELRAWWRALGGDDAAWSATLGIEL